MSGKWAHICVALSLLTVFDQQIFYLTSASYFHKGVSMGLVDVNTTGNMSNFTKADALERERAQYKDMASNAFDRENIREQQEQNKLESLKEKSELWQERRGKNTIIIILVAVCVLFLLIVICCCRRRYLRKKAE